MEPAISTSFIPKRPIESAATQSVQVSKQHSFVSLLVFLIIIGTAAAYGISYVYESQLLKQKVALESQLASARDGIGTDFVSDMKRLDQRIKGVKTLLGSHVAVSPVFDALQATTLHSIQYTSFDYEFQTDDTTKKKIVRITLLGVAKTYNAIALQSDAFQGNTLIINPVFSGLTIDDKTHTVGFKLTFSVDPAKLSYQSFIDSAQQSQ